MLKGLTRAKVIRIWFVAVALVVAGALTLGANLSLGMWALILGMCLIPPTMVYMLWPGTQTRSMKDMIYDETR